MLVINEIERQQDADHRYTDLASTTEVDCESKHYIHQIVVII